MWYSLASHLTETISIFFFFLFFFFYHFFRFANSFEFVTILGTWSETATSCLQRKPSNVAFDSPTNKLSFYVFSIIIIIIFLLFLNVTLPWNCNSFPPKRKKKTAAGVEEKRHRQQQILTFYSSSLIYCKTYGSFVF